MAKQINFSFEGKDYTLEFNRDSVRAMERQGFNLQDIDVKPMLTLPRLFQGAFMMHHASIKIAKVDEIYNFMSNKQELVTKLAEMYNDTVATLMEENEENEGKNIEWKAS